MQELQEGLDTAAALQQLVQERHHVLGEDWAADLGRDLQVPCRCNCGLYSSSMTL